MHLKNIFQLLGIFSIPIAIIFGIWYIWFGPGAEIDPKFPRDPQGIFIEPVEMTIENKNILAHWVVPAVCDINEVEFQYDGEQVDSWMGAAATCIQEERGFTCQVDLSDSELSKEVNYRLQAHNSLCTDGNFYVSEITTFSL